MLRLCRGELDAKLSSTHKSRRRGEFEVPLCRRRMPDWQPIVSTYLARFPTITSADVDRTEHWASNASMFSATGSWRAKVVRGELFVKFIRAHSHWAERASVLRIVVLALDGLRREGISLPDFDFVYAHNDKDPTPDSFPKCRPPRRRRRGKTRGAEPSEPPCAGAPIPLFTNARRAVRHSDGAIGAGGLPLPDFTWLGWGAQLPWCQLSAQLQREAARHGQWSGRDARAIFSGGLDNGRDRKELRRLVRQHSVEAQRLSHTYRPTCLARGVVARPWPTVRRRHSRP